MHPWRKDLLMPHSEVPRAQLNGDGTISLSVVVTNFPSGTPIVISGQATQDNGAVATFYYVRSMPELSEGINEAVLTVKAAPGPNVEFVRNKKITVVAQASLVWSTTLKPVLITPLNLEPGSSGALDATLQTSDSQVQAEWSVENSASAVWPPQPAPSEGSAS